MIAGNGLVRAHAFLTFFFCAQFASIATTNAPERTLPAYVVHIDRGGALETERVALGGCPPRAPTDPNVRN